MSNLKTIQRLYGQSYISYSATYLAAILVFWLFQGISHSKVLTIWFAIFSLFTFLRFVMTWRYNQTKHNEENETWLMIFLIMSAISGTMWGLSGFLFIPEDELSLLDSVLYHGMLFLFIASLIGGSIITYSASKTVYLSFSFPAVVPQSFMLIAQGDKYHSFLGGIFLAYGAVMFLISVYINRVFAEHNNVDAENDRLRLLLKRNDIKCD
ncbi:MAG: hypothetical protein DHS20C09_05320 [marine bacterium B5-7]|nr:MAG: hypothetical protein DHS20C09_05320 [marine bacterium B5-7]